MTTEENKQPEDQATPENSQAAGGEQSQAPSTPEEQIAALQEQLLEARDRTMRALADAENTRKRAVKDRDDAGKYAIAGFARNLLDFSDNFKRALDAIPDDLKTVDPRIASVIEGIEAMRRELSDTFERNGVRKISPLDEPFDANYHEVMFEAPFPGKPAGTVIQVVESGYVLNDRLLRAAKVGIAKAEDGAAAGEHKVDKQA